MKKFWDTLSASDKQQLMRIYIKNGIRDIEGMKTHYNTYAQGGDSLSSTKETDDPDTGTITQGKEWSKFDHWITEHPYLMKRLRKAGVLLTDLLALHPKLGIVDDIYDIANQKPQEERTFREDNRQAANVTGLAGRVLNNTYGTTLRTVGADTGAKIINMFFKTLNVPDILFDAWKFAKDFATPIEEFDGRNRE